MSDCGRVGCGHPEEVHVEVERQQYRRMANGGFGSVTFVHRECTLCKCPNFAWEIICPHDVPADSPHFARCREAR